MRRISVTLIALLLLAAGLWVTGLLENTQNRPGDSQESQVSRPPKSAPDLLRGGAATQPALHGTQPPVAAAATPDGQEEPKDFTLTMRGTDGTVVARARVRFVSDDDGSPDTVLREASFELPAVLDGFAKPFWIEIVSAMDAAGVPLPLKRGWSGPHDAADGVIHVLLKANRVVAGHVFDANGRPLPGTRVAFFRERFHQFEKVLEITSGKHGAFRAAGLAQRSYFLTAYPGGSNAPPDPLAVQAGDTDVALRMRPGIIATLVVVTGDQSPVAGARVRVVNSIPVEDGRIQRTVALARTDARGRAELGGLDPQRTHVLRIRPPEARRDLVPLRYTAWLPADDRLTLDRGRVLRGQVVRTNGEPAKGVWIGVRSESWTGPYREGRTDSDGRFSIMGLSPEALVVQGEFGGTAMSARWFTNRRRVEAGEDNLRLVLRRWVSAQVIVRVRNWVPGAEGAIARLSGDTVGGLRASIGAVVNRVGEARFRVSQPASHYTLYVVTKDETQCLYERSIAHSKGTLAVDLIPALEVRGRVQAPPSATALQVRVTGPGFQRDAALGPGGTFRVGGMPAGTWTLRASARINGTHLTTTMEVAAGEKVDVRLSLPEQRAR